MHFCRFVHHDIGIESDLRELLEEELYRFFAGPSLGDSGAPPSQAGDVATGTDDGVGPTAQVIRKVVQRVKRSAAVERFTAGHPEIAERAAHEAVQWCANQAAAGFEQEAYRELERLETLLPDEFDPPGRVIDLLAELTTKLGESEESAFLRTRLSKLSSELSRVTSRASEAPSDSRALVLRESFRAAVAAARRELGQRISRRKEGLLTEVFAHSFPAFVDELNDLLPRLAAVQRRLEDFFGTSKGLWDRELRDWEELPWADLEHLAHQLQGEDSLRRLAALLGRMSREHDRRVPTRTLVPYRKVHRETICLGRSEVEGITTGIDLGGLLPQELSLLSDDVTVPLFDKRFADGALLIRSYKTREDVERTVTRWAVGEAPPSPGGPIVICVDTSGSMAGEPERIAKLATLALTREALELDRACYLIFFSTTIVSIEVTDHGASLERLVGYLNGSVRGGTDVAVALRAALAMLETQSYENADVLVISDFRIPKIPGDLRRRLSDQQSSCGTRFHSLTVTDRRVKDPHFLFDYRWLYDTSNPLSRGIPPEAFRLLH